MYCFRCSLELNISLTGQLLKPPEIEQMKLLELVQEARRCVPLDGIPPRPTVI